MPAFGTSFIGRDRDLAAIARLVDDGARLVTLLGPAGVGKTRLASAFAEGRGGTVVDLSGARAPFDACAALARAIGVSLSSSSTLDEALATLTGALPEGGLLVLDNFEQLAGVAARVVERLVEDTSASVLVTSRERLRLAAESTLDLGPLAPEHARALFVDRATMVRHGYAPDQAERAAIDAVCRELDGLPLAIELAAARMRVMTAAELAARLGERFEILSENDRAFAARHTTLRSALDWSWSLMDEAERSALAQCSVFAGGFTLEAAEAVLSADGPVLDRLQSLRDKSLLWAEESPLGTRYSLYLSVRDHAAEKLADNTALDRHRDHYLERGFFWAARAEGREAGTARSHLEAEHDNLLAVHRRAVAAGQADPALRAAIALQPILITRGPAALRLELLDRALELPSEGVHRRLLGWARLARGDTLFGLGRMAESREMFEQAIRDGVSEEDERLRGRALWRLGTLCWAQDRSSEAEVVLKEALQLHRTVADRIHEGRCLASLGVLALDHGNLDLAGDRFEEALDLHEETGDERWVGRTIGHLGALEDARGNLEEARQLYLQAISVHERLGDRAHLAQVLGAIAALEAELGNVEPALSSFERALAIRREVPDRRTEGVVRMQLGACLEQIGDLEGAQRRIREAVRIHRAIDNPRLQTVALAHLARVEGAKRPERTRSRLREAEAVGAAEGDTQIEALLAIVSAHVRPAEEANRIIEEVAPVVDRSAMVRRAARALRARLSDGVPADALVVGEGWFKPPRAARVDISSRRAPSALLRALSEARRKRPGASLSVDDLFAAGWPGERALPAAAASRVYVAISTLRKLGLKDLLIRDETGYRFDPNVPVVAGD